MKDEKWMVHQANLLWEEIKRSNSNEKVLSDLRKIIVLFEVLDRKKLIVDVISNERDLVERITANVKKEVKVEKD